MTPALDRCREARREAEFRLLAVAGADFPAAADTIRYRLREYWVAHGREMKAAYRLVRRRARFAGESPKRDFEHREARRYFADVAAFDPYSVRRAHSVLEARR